MCLAINKRATARIRKILKEKGKISVWKYLTFHPGKKGKLAKLSSVAFKRTKWKPGENVSNRTSIKLTDSENSWGIVERGFHFYLKRPPNAKAYYYLQPVRCVVKAEDFVAAGRSQATDNEAVVFMKATLSTKEYKRVLGLAEKLKREFKMICEQN
jgi:hypothetical protein